MSAPDPLKGYKGRARARLEAFGVRVWSDVRATNDAGSVFEGVVLPRSESLDDEHVVLKLKAGYNVGLHVDRVRTMDEVGYKEAFYRIPEKAFPSRPHLPTVTLLGTGGTIASRLDYRRGAVIPAFTPGELYGAVRELADVCNLKTEKLFGIFSENMGPEQWVATAKAIGRESENGADGIIIGHGTDTMHHTAAFDYITRAGAQSLLCDVTDRAAVDRAFTGREGAELAVVCILGGSPQLNTQGNINVIDAAVQAGVQRFVLTTSIGCGDSAAALDPFVKAIAGRAIRAKEWAENHLRATALDWTIVRAGGTTRRPGTGTAMLTASTMVTGYISFTDLGDMLFLPLTSPRTSHRALAAVDSARAVNIDGSTVLPAEL